MNRLHQLRLLAAGALLAAGSIAVSAQDAPGEGDSQFTPYYKFRVTFTDKKNCGFSVRHPEAFLSQRAIERRRRQGISIGKTDLPVSRIYIDQVTARGAKALSTSKWNNTLLVSTGDSLFGSKIQDLPFVGEVRMVAQYRTPREVSKADRHALVAPKERPEEREVTNERPVAKTGKPDTLILDPDKDIGEDDLMRIIRFINDHNPQNALDNWANHTGRNAGIPEVETSIYGKGKKQIEQLNGKPLHAAGFKGEGMVIAIIDGGFYNADIIPGLGSTKILGTKDFVAPEEEFYGTQSHGMMVLSCIGANEPYNMVGTAPEASFWLLRSEDGDSEQLVEEDNWAAAIEYADSVGADVVNTSLGYASFDNWADNVRYYELDGHSQLISNSASMCADKGMVLVCSAGNSGNDLWKLITSPADSENTLTVAAIDEDGNNAMFSSIGYTADGRIKPDIATRGQFAWLFGTNGKVTQASGTSFSSPIACGMVACLWQALPGLTAKELIEVVRKSGDRAGHPDPIYGYGIPDFFKAYSIGLTK